MVKLKVGTLTHLWREFKKWCTMHETSYTLPKGWEKIIYEILLIYTASFLRYSDRAVARQTPVAQISLSFFLILLSVFWGLFSLYWLAWQIGNTKFRITFQHLKMYVSTQKLSQIFLYMPTTCCESFKAFGEIGEKGMSFIVTLQGGLIFSSHKHAPYWRI